MVLLYGEKLIQQDEIAAALHYLRRRWGRDARHAAGVLEWLGKRALEEGWVKVETDEERAALKKRELRAGLAARTAALREPTSGRSGEG